MYNFVHYTLWRPDPGLTWSNGLLDGAEVAPGTHMIPIDEILVLVTLNAIVDAILSITIVLVILSRRTERMMGVTKVKNDSGEVIYAPLDPDGKPFKVPITRVVDGKPVTKEEYVGLAWALPALASAHIKQVITGKAGKMVQTAEAQMLEGMPLEQASTAIAMNALAKGQVGKAFIAYLAPKIAAAINQSGQAGQSMSPQYGKRSGPI